MKLLVPVFIGLGSLLYPLAIGSKIISSNTKLNLNTDLLNPSKHSSVAFTPELYERNTTKQKIVKIFLYSYFNIYYFIRYIYTFIIYAIH